MKLNGRTWVSEFYGKDNGRSASILSSWSGYEVEFKKDGQLVERRVLEGYNNYYAEDACRNWVEEVIK